MQDIDISEYIDKFSMHLQNNPRAILSARFGDGKTTFLKKFEETTQDENFFLKIYPINYSVAKNEDIFEYIKHDILIQLLQDTNLIADIQLDEKAFLDAIKNNVFTLDNLLKAISFVGCAVPAAAPFLNCFSALSDKIKGKGSFGEAWKKYTENKVSMSKYMDHFAQLQGGLYEEDGYTLLIQEALKQVKQRKILIIEDLDRIDPKHLFRILNVLGAHVDENNDQNKFGFDNIVIVLDYDVTDSIFHHMYGDKANYQGYMSKFLSSYPFTFSISQVAYTKVYEFIERKCNITQNEMSKLALGNVTMNTIYFPQLLNSLSVRDIAHALDGIEQQLIPDKKITIYGQEYSTDVPIIWLIALLKRLRGNISESVIYKGLLSLKTETMLNTLDIMLLGGSLSTGRYFSFGNDVFGIHHVDWNNPNGDKRVFVKNNMMVPNIDVDMHVAIQNAISKSFKYVADVVPG